VAQRKAIKIISTQMKAMKLIFAVAFALAVPYCAAQTKKVSEMSTIEFGK
jgi:hypothetical protein